MIKFLFLLLFSFSAYSTSELDLFKQTDEELCVYKPRSQIDSLAEAALKYGNSYCKDYTQDTFFNSMMGCYKGYWNGTKATITSFADLVHFVVIDNPVYDLYKAAFHELIKIGKGDYSPSDMANQFANLNLRSQNDIYNQSKKYLQQLKAFSVDFKNQINAKIKEFPCLPREEQSEIICRGLTEVFFLAVSPGKFVQGARWGAEHAAALSKFVTETNKMKGLSDLNMAKRLNLATEALKGPKNIKELMRFKKGRLIEQTLPNGELALKFEERMVGLDGKVHMVSRDIAIDVNTKAITSKEGFGHELLKQMVDKQQGKGSLISIDINNLGKANYFKNTRGLPEGTSGGDFYLAQVAESIRKQMRPGDLLFKNGGDELVIVLNTKDPNAIKDIGERIVKEVDANPQVRQYFKSQVMNVKDRYTEVNKATSLKDIPEPVKSNYTKAELDLAKSNFKEFKKAKLDELKGDLSKQAGVRGSISLGSALIRAEDTLEAVVTRADAQVGLVKAKYKAKYGQVEDVQKYQIKGLEKSKSWGPAEVLEPVP